MFRARWRSHFHPPLVPPAVALGTAVLISLAAAQASTATPFGKPGAPADCSDLGIAHSAAGRHHGLLPGLAQRLDARGEFLGRSVSVNAPGRALALSLPIESFVASPVGDALVYTQSTGAVSEVHVVDLATGCDALVDRLVGTVRSAIVDQAGSTAYIHSVSFPFRADAGVISYALDSGASAQVLPPLGDDARFGPTFGTQLGFSLDGHTLFAQSCGQAECRTRLFDAASGATSTFDALGQGQIIGVTAAHLVTYGDCVGLPCSVQSTDFASGSTTSLADEAWAASLVATDSGAVARMETAAGTIEVPQ